MNDALMQKTRYVLHSRFRIPQSSPDDLFSPACAQILTWIENHLILAPIASALKREFPKPFEQVEKIIKDTSDNITSYNPGNYMPKTINERAALCYAIMYGAKLAQKNERSVQQFQYRCLSEYITGNENNDLDEVMEVLKDVAVDGFFEYLDEHLDDRNAAFGLLLKYKQLTEWFNQEKIRQIASHGENRRGGERALAADLQAFIMQQGVEFVVEPMSAGGEVDLVLRDSNGRYLLIDAKYMKEDATRNDILQKLKYGFHQLMRYCEDYNEPYGFLITFNASSKRIALGASESDGMTFVKIGSKCIYHVVVNLTIEPTASKLGQASEVKIEEDELKKSEDKAI